MKAVLLLLLALAGPTSVVSAQAHLLIVSGSGGEQRFIDDFHAWGVMLVDAARERFGMPDGNVVYLAEAPDRDPQRITDRSTRANVERAVREMAERADPDDRVLIVLIGHGSSDSRGERINLPGPDLTAVELADHLRAFPTQPIVVVHTGSASGGFHEPLAGPNRTIITATRSGMEFNATIFGRFFAEAFALEGADADRDGRVSIMEAYEYATREVERAYATTNRMQSERARIEGDMELARAFSLGAAVVALPEDAPPELRALHADRQRLEEAVSALRVRSGQLEPGEYEAFLERLLLELARVNRDIRAFEGAD